VIIKLEIDVDKQELYEWLEDAKYSEDDLFDDPDILLLEYLGGIVAPYVVSIEG
jgi:hypothetical protein